MTDDVTATAAEFVRCAKAGLAFLAGYKAGERYTLGILEIEHARAADAEAWRAGFDLADKRYAARHPTSAGYGEAAPEGMLRITAYDPPPKDKPT